MLLDVFQIMFESDASDLNDGLDKSKKKTKDLEKDLNTADKTASELGGSFKNLIATAGGAMAALFSLAAIKSGITQSAEYANNIGLLSDALGVNANEMSRWGSAAEMMGGDLQGMADSFMDMNESIGEALKDTESERAKTFKALNMSLIDTAGNSIGAVEGMLRLADSVSTLSKQEAIFRIKQVGITDNKIVNMILKGRTELENLIKRQKELGGVTKNQIEVSKEFGYSLKNMEIGFRSLFLDLGEKILPIFGKFIDSIADMTVWVRKHSDFVIGFIMAITAALSIYLIPALYKAGAAAAVAFGPYLLMGAIIVAVAAAFALLYDDIMNFAAGNESVIGDILKKYPKIEKTVRDVGAAFKWLWDTAKAVFNFLADAIDKPGEAWDKFIAKIKDGIEYIRGAFPDVFGEIGSAIDEVNKTIDETGKFWGDVWDDMWGSKEVAMTANASPFNTVTPAMVAADNNSTVSTTVNVGKVEVNTQATDAEGISKTIGNTMKDQVKKATAQYDDGIKG